MKPVRCAIYTRKSSEEGLEQGFNSLDAQREACAAYVLSQASEGWTALPDVYDDGGISGGTLARPALQRLLADVAAGKVDIIVVYKVDRLTRSLLDFSKLVEAFDKAGVSFVSITQSFNTTTSMGRLTLNMLLSFAQFEREVTAERIRDKIAASKAKGMWMGGIPPLGYRPDGRSLAVVEEHAAIVRHIFERYLTLGTVRAVAADLERADIRSPVRTMARTGAAFGGTRFSRGQIYTLLKCPTYIGEVHHREQVHAGLQEPIIDRETWDAVQALLARNRQGHQRGERALQPSPLAGRLFDEAGQPLIAAHTRKGSKRYRYYVSRALHHGSNASGKRIPARELERAIGISVAGVLADPLNLLELSALAELPMPLTDYYERAEQLASDMRRGHGPTFTALIQSVTVNADDFAIAIQRNELAQALGVRPEILHGKLRVRASLRVRRCGRVNWLIDDSGVRIGPNVPFGLLQLIGRGRAWWQQLAEGKTDIKQLAAAEGVTASYLTRIVRLAFLAPQVVAALVVGRCRAGVTAGSLTATGAIDPCWRRQTARMVPEGIMCHATVQTTQGNSHLVDAISLAATKG